MYFKFGKYSDKLVEIVLLKDPNYIAWILGVPNPKGRMLLIKSEIQRLIRIFDAKPFLRNCRGRDCTRLATRLSVYFDDVYHPMYWCEDCDPSQMGARDGQLSMVKTYQDARLHHTLFHTPKSFLKDLVRNMAVEKGLPKRVGEKEAEGFFGRL